jgi:hypothetical protein
MLTEEPTGEAGAARDESVLMKLLAFRDIFSEIHRLMNDDCGHGYWRVEGFVSEPKGYKQTCESRIFDHEFIYQSCSIAGDDYAGYVYFPMGNGEYVVIAFEC